MTAWVDTLVATARYGALTMEQHKLFASWNEKLVRMSWAGRSDLPQSVISERLTLESDETIYSALLAKTSIVTQEIVNNALRNGREAAYSLATSSSCDDTFALQIYKSLRNVEKGWLETKISGSWQQKYDNREKTIEYLLGTLNLNIFWRMLQHTTTSAQKKAALRRLTSLHPGAEDTKRIFGSMSQLNFTTSEYEIYLKVLERQTDETKKHVAEVTGAHMATKADKEKVKLARSRRSKLIELADVDLEAAVEAVLEEAKTDAKIAADVATCFLVERKDIDLKMGAKLIALADNQTVIKWAQKTFQNANKDTSDTVSRTELAELAGVLCSRKEYMHVSSLISTLEKLGNVRWDALQEALISKAHLPLRNAAEASARTAAQVRWLWEKKYISDKSAVSHKATGLELLLDIDVAEVLKEREAVKILMPYLLETLTAAQLEMFDKLHQEWTGSTKALIETIQVL